MVARIADTTLKRPDPTIEELQSVVVLPFIFTYFQIMEQGITAGVMDVKVRRNWETSQNSKSLAMSFSNALASMYKSDSKGALSLEGQTITNILIDFVSATSTLNKAVKDISDELYSVVVDVKELARHLLNAPEVILNPLNGL